MATFSHIKHIKLSIALEVIINQGFAVRRGLSPRELLILDGHNTVMAIIDIEEEANGREFIDRAHLALSFATFGVTLK